MNIVLATPLYPPDIAEPAPYVKELAKRLSSEHTVTLVVYGALPERVRGVEIVAVAKDRPLPLRLLAYTAALYKTAHSADVIYAQNGPSVELPLAMVRLLTATPTVIHIGDRAAHEYAASHSLRRMLEHLVTKGARATLDDASQPRPEILPFEPYPQKEFESYEAWWTAHLNRLISLFAHGQ
ncbi:MAG: glycosyltransferase [Candidatus Adlerbacteria bacterium]|nr:glycosyltransferase [Candidatus Adlerbacteria bacterium]